MHESALVEIADCEADEAGSVLVFAMGSSQYGACFENQKGKYDNRGIQ